jgi:hypothetical protein
MWKNGTQVDNKNGNDGNTTTDSKPSTKKLCKPASPEENGVNSCILPHMNSLSSLLRGVLE